MNCDVAAGGRCIHRDGNLQSSSAQITSKGSASSLSYKPCGKQAIAGFYKTQVPTCKFEAAPPSAALTLAALSWPRSGPSDRGVATIA